MAQPSELTLFSVDADAGPATIDTAAWARAEEHRLDDHSSITVVRGFMRGHESLLQQLNILDDWQQRQRWMYDRLVHEPRLTKEFRDLAGAPPAVVDIASALSRECGVAYDGVWMNWYRDHRDSTGWHADRPADTAATAVVPVLSLGATRRFLLRQGSRGPSTAFVVDGGDLLVMRGRCQRDWQHCVPKQRTPAGARISLNFTSTSQAAR